jgi:hypothetical protein
MKQNANGNPPYWYVAGILNQGKYFPGIFENPSELFSFNIFD